MKNKDMKYHLDKVTVSADGNLNARGYVELVPGKKLQYVSYIKANPLKVIRNTHVVDDITLEVAAHLGYAYKEVNFLLGTQKW